MTTALLVSNLLLWLVVIALAATVLALARQVGVLHERVAPAGALLTRDGPDVGSPAPAFELEGLSGDPVRIGGERADGRSTFLFFLSPSCPICKTLLPAVVRVVAADGRTDLVLASDGVPDEHRAFVRRERLERHAYVLSTEVGLAYGVTKLPYAALIDAAGRLRARGLVNTREHVESLFEARERGVGSIQELLAREAGRGAEVAGEDEEESAA